MLSVPAATPKYLAVFSDMVSGVTVMFIAPEIIGAQPGIVTLATAIRQRDRTNLPPTRQALRRLLILATGFMALS